MEVNLYGAELNKSLELHSVGKRLKIHSIWRVPGILKSLHTNPTPEGYDRGQLWMASYTFRTKPANLSTQLKSWDFVKPYAYGHLNCSLVPGEQNEHKKVVGGPLGELEM